MKYRHPVCSHGPAGGKYGTWYHFAVVAAVILAAVILVWRDLGG